MVKRCGLFSLFFLIFCSLSQLFAQAPLSVVLEPNPVGVRDNTGLVIDLPLDSTAGVDVEIPDLPEGVQIYRGPYIRRYYGSDYSDQGHERFVRISFTLRSYQSGPKVLPPFLVHSEEGSFKTEPMLLDVGIYKSGRLRIPFSPYWEGSKQKLYVGETISMVLKVPEQREVFFVDDVRISEPAEGIFESSELSGEVERDELMGFQFYTLAAAGYLLTPVSPGRLTVPAALVEIDGLREWAPKIQLEVLPLPDEISESGAIGTFQYRSSWDLPSELQEGDRFRLRLEISGEGNLPYLTIPEPECLGAELVSRKISDSYAVAARNYKGTRGITYEYSIGDTEEIFFSFPDFTYLQPGNGAFRRLSIPSKKIRVRESVAESSSEAREDSFPFEPRLISSLAQSNEDSYRHLKSYLWLLPGPLLFIVFFFFRSNRAAKAALFSILFSLLISAGGGEIEEKSRFVEARAAYDAGENEKACRIYQDLLHNYPGHADLHFNTAVTAYKAGQVGKAVYHARTAYRLLPSNSEHRRLLQYIEEYRDFGFQIPLPFFIHPDCFFFMLLLFCNAAGFVGVFYLIRRKTVYSIAAALLLFCSASSAAALGFSAYDWSREVAVCDKALDVLTIPQEGASTLFRLDEGETVRVRGESRGFYFIETAVDTNGWIQEDLLLFPAKEKH